MAGTGKETGHLNALEDQKTLKEAADRIIKIHPKVQEPSRTKCFIIGAIHKVAQVAGGNYQLQDSIKYVEGKTHKYKNATASWPIKERDYIKGSVNWYMNECYLEDSKTWIKGDQLDDFTGVRDGKTWGKGKMTGYSEVVL